MKTLKGVVQDVIDNTDVDELVTQRSADQLVNELVAALILRGFPSEVD